MTSTYLHTVVPRRLSVTCPDTVPDSGSAEIPVVWNSPQLSPDVTLFVVQLQYACLYNGTLNNVSAITGQLLVPAYRQSKNRLIIDVL